MVSEIYMFVYYQLISYRQTIVRMIQYETKESANGHFQVRDVFMYVKYIQVFSSFSSFSTVSSVFKFSQVFQVFQVCSSFFQVFMNLK